MRLLGHDAVHMRDTPRASLMSEPHRITVDPTICGGRPTIRGLRVRVKAERPPCPPERVVRVVVDAQLPPALAAWLAPQGHDAVHVFARLWRRGKDGRFEPWRRDG